MGGAVTVAAAILFAFWLPGLRPEARRLIVAQEMAGGGLTVDPRGAEHDS
ncbi:MAG TPA: hypothetical protein VN442_14425 [Bryobacteraceae bacterium]|nr:hypothetical protein [Bryobacteraceae bacterium]